MRLAPKPWWLFWYPRKTWVTWNGTVYHPRGVDPSTKPHFLTHEAVHVRQQSQMGRWTFLWKYVTDKSERLDLEAEAFAAEKQHHTTEGWPSKRLKFAVELAGKPYWSAAPSVQAAVDAISRYESAQ